MLQYTLRRLGFLLLTLLITSVIIFVIAQLLPGDVARIRLGREASEEAVAAMRVKLGLNDPAPVRYVRWLSDFVQANWGTTYPDNVDIYPLVLQRLSKSMWLALAALVMAVPVSVALCVWAVLKADNAIDGVISRTS